MIPRIVFMGSPEFAVTVLEKLSEKYPVVGVITQPDRPAGRGRNLTPPPVKELSLSLRIPYIQPERLKESNALDQLKNWNPDLIIVAAYGQILRRNVLEMPKFGCLNVHASILPRWRGATPIQAAILHGDKLTGVTIIKMDEGVDTGPILSKKEVQIDSMDTGLTLSQKLSVAGAQLLLDTLPGYTEGSIHPQPQDESHATYAKLLRKEDGLLDFSKSAEELERKVRAFNPWPGTFFDLQGAPCKVIRAGVVTSCSLEAGEHGSKDGIPLIGTSMHALSLLELQPAGKKPMAGDQFLRGYRGW